MPVLGVCGDSYMAATINKDRSDTKDSEGKHFTEILAKRIGYDYFTLARGACSNTAIRAQITEMVKEKVDLVIIGFTSFNRLEIPKTGKTYDDNIGVYNLDYRTEYYPDRSTLNPKFKHNLISETLTNIFTNDKPLFARLFNVNTVNCYPLISQSTIIALEYYIDHLYDEKYKAQLDRWIIHSGIKLLQDHNINFVIINSGLYYDIEFENFQGARFIPSCTPMDPKYYPTEGQRRWHTSDESQEKLAELWYNHLINNNLI